MGFSEKEGGCQIEQRRGGRSVRRCPEIQDVVIRQLGERERKRKKESERERKGLIQRVKKGGGECASRRNAFIFLLL